MAGEWRDISLGKACLKIGSGATPRGGKEAYLGGDTALIRSQNIYNDRFVRDGLVFIDNKQADELKNVAVEKGDVLLNITGDSVARCCQVDTDVLPARVNQHVAIIRPNAEVLDAAFLRYSLVSPSVQAHLLALASAGATRNALTKAMIESLSVIAPRINEQRTIAHILGTLDDKIELNRRRNQTLEAMARALFKDWFVDFGPVRAKMQLPSPAGRGVGGEGSNPQPRRKLPLPDTIRQHAVELRRNATDAENLLWRLLRNRQLANAKFRRQHAVPPYILDFYCNELKLAVELDGGQHNEPAGRAHDDRRTEYLHARGIEVLRFWNHDVLRDTEAVLEAIYRAIEAKPGPAPSPPAPLPEGEGSTAHDPLLDALKPFSLREKGWDEGAYLPPNLWNLFPDRLDDEGKPEGWRRSTIGSEVTVYGGSTPSTKEPAYWEGGEHHWATPKDLSALAFPVLLDTDRKITDAGIAKISSGLLPVGTVLLSSRAPIGYLAIAEVPTAINQGFIAIKCDGSLPNVFVLFWCRENMDLILGNANGSTFQEISKSNFRPIPVIVPQDSILNAFRERTEPLYRHIVENELESRALAQLRDTLLPKLISGELRIADAEKFMERAEHQAASQTGSAS